MRKIWLLLIVVNLYGCATVCDLPKNVAGFSTMDMEDARGQAVYQAYSCDFRQCFAAVVGAVEERKMGIFLKDEKRGLLVLMGVPGVVDTTEVGVFFTRLSQQKGIKVEVSSRSSPARRVVAQFVFGELSKKFSKSL